MVLDGVVPPTTTTGMNFGGAQNNNNNTMGGAGTGLAGVTAAASGTNLLANRLVPLTNTIMANSVFFLRLSLCSLCSLCFLFCPWSVLVCLLSLCSVGFLSESYQPRCDPCRTRPVPRRTPCEKAMSNVVCSTRNP